MNNPQRHPTTRGGARAAQAQKHRKGYAQADTKGELGRRDSKSDPGFTHATPTTQNGHGENAQQRRQPKECMSPQTFRKKPLPLQHKQRTENSRSLTRHKPNEQGKPQSKQKGEGAAQAKTLARRPDPKRGAGRERGESFVTRHSQSPPKSR